MDDEIVLRQPLIWSWSMIHLSTWSRLIVLSLADLLFLLRHESHLELLHRTQKPIRPECVNADLSATSGVNLFVRTSQVQTADEDVDDESEQVELRKMNKSGKA